MLIMTSVIRIGQSKFVTHPIDEDSQDRILNCIQTLSELEDQPSVQELFLEETKAAYTKMLSAQEVRTDCCNLHSFANLTITMSQKKAAEKMLAEASKEAIVQVDDLLSFRQFTKKGADDAIDVSLLSLAMWVC